MTPARVEVVIFWVAIAVILVLLARLALFLIGTFGTPHPAGRRRRRRSRLTARVRDRQQAARDEHARDTATREFFTALKAEHPVPAGDICRDLDEALNEATVRLIRGPAAAMAAETEYHSASRGEAALAAMPLPEITHGGLAGQPGKNGGDTAGLTGPFALESPPSPDLPEDPHDLLTPEEAADAWVGDLGPAELPLTDYQEDTGSWTRLVADVLHGTGGER